MTETGRDDFREQELKQAVEANRLFVFVPVLRELDVGPPCRFSQATGIGCHQVHAGTVSESILAAETLDATGAQRGRHELLQQRCRVVERAAGGIPFEKEKLDVVAAAAFTVPKRMGKLVDRPCSSCEQPLHQGLRARLQKPLSPVCGLKPQGLNMRLGQHLQREHRGIDFQKAVAVEDLPHRLPDGLPMAEDLAGLMHAQAAPAVDQLEASGTSFAVSR